MFVIGTAGHIDHGKSSIIRRLTGIDPDRLPEEKAREMTIDLGFAWYDTSDGTRIGIVDVPGHERFVRNMIAGVGGIDAVILVVAADDGWMPQSQEHLQIVKLLGVTSGIIALTKIDLAEESWIDLVAEDIREKVTGTGLADAPMVRLSSQTGKGFDELKSEIDKLSRTMVEREVIDKPRLYIDRAFVLPGMGGVATGTLRGGILEVGREIAVFPSRKTGKVRTLQSHNTQVTVAQPGQRTAVSLTGIDKEYITRGSVLTVPELALAYPDQPVFAMSVELLPESPIVLQDRRRLLLIIGTTELEGEIRLYDRDTLNPGEKGIIFFKPFEAVLGFVGDRFILRLPTPQITVGGGMVIDLLDRFPRKKQKERFVSLHRRIDLTPHVLVDSRFDRQLFVKTDDFRYTTYADATIKRVFSDMLTSGKIKQTGDRYYRPADVADMTGRIVTAVTSYIQTHSHKDGVPLEKIAAELRQSAEALEPIIGLLCEEGQLVKRKNVYDVPGRTISASGEIKRVADAMEKQLHETEFSPPTIKELVGDDAVKREALDYLLRSNSCVKVGGILVYHRSVWNRMLDTIRSMLREKGSISVAELRERLNSSRKYIVPIFETVDQMEITKREGDVRVKGDRFDQS
ncbi:MAG: selenocysteine-specific translation elongation factor [candidate division Zixibacteria bacterium]|nr:selenocysteine-specific translation elongation factor [candidate division Zixibacteria bacterium]